METNFLPGLGTLYAYYYLLHYLKPHTNLGVIYHPAGLVIDLHEGLVSDCCFKMGS